MDKLVRTNLGEVLIAAGAITEEDLALAKGQLADRPIPPGNTLIDRLVAAEITSEGRLATALGDYLKLPLVNLSQIVAEPDLLSLVPQNLAERHEFVPIRRMEDGVGLAMSDPTDILAVDDVKLAAGVSEVTIAVAALTDIREARTRLYEVNEVASQLLDRLGVAGEIEVVSESPDPESEGEAGSRKRPPPIVGLVNAILADAVRARATDVHIEPASTKVDVRYRVDGLLREVLTLPKHLQALVASRLKVISAMDIADRRRPQDGRTRIVVDGQKVDLRISSIPTLPGEKLVARLLYKNGTAHDLDAIGLNEQQLELVKRALAMPQGLIVFTGPTGSGKTSTMYGGLISIQSPEKNTITLEDPIEYELPGLNQVQIDEKSGITFARGLRSVLRQDPDVIMVGEIRDQETARIAMQAAMTGHLVLSSLHTNDAVSAVGRLVDLGIEPYLVSSGLSIVIAQRLIRVICENCKQDAAPSDETLTMLGLSEKDLQELEPKSGIGCEDCGYTGYKGRTGIYEVLPITSEIREQIDAQFSETSILRTARAAGVSSLREAGLEKVRRGLSTLEEVLRVTHTETQTPQRCPSCRQQIESAFVVCPYCQCHLRPRSCPQCKEGVMAEWKVCPYCEAPLPHAAQARTAAARILVVDDDETQLRLARRGLADQYDVIEARTGEHALREANIRRPDLIVLDLNLPDMTGVEVTTKLRQAAATSLIPVVMLTGSPDDDDELASLRAGVDDYLRKPYDFVRLRARIENILDRHPEEGTLSETSLSEDIEIKWAQKLDRAPPLSLDEAENLG